MKKKVNNYLRSESYVRRCVILSKVMGHNYYKLGPHNLHYLLNECQSTSKLFIIIMSKCVGIGQWVLLDSLFCLCPMITCDPAPGCESLDLKPVEQQLRS